MTPQSMTIVMPVYNEGGAVAETLRHLRAIASELGGLEVLNAVHRDGLPTKVMLLTGFEDSRPLGGTVRDLARTFVDGCSGHGERYSTAVVGPWVP